MTKAELIEQMAKDANVSKVAAGAVLDSFMANVTKALKKKDGKVTLVGFGTLTLQKPVCNSSVCPLSPTNAPWKSSHSASQAHEPQSSDCKTVFFTV